MKRISVILLILVFLCGCQKSTAKLLEELGYSEEDITLIESLSEENQARFLESYDEELLELIKLQDFKEEKIDEYLKYRGDLEDEKLIEMVNNGMINDDNHSKLKELYASEYYVPRKEKLYLQYLDSCNDVRSMMEIVNTGRYRDLYTDIETTDVSKKELMLVNKYYQLPADYVPDELVDVEAALGRGQLQKEVYEAYKPLYEEAKKLGYDLTIVSSYRSYDYQYGLYNKYLQSDPQEVVDTYSARPGHSEHQSGLCMDVTIPGYSLDNFYKSDASKWLAENCYRFGFIIRYPEDKTDITGYQGEPWQLRYLGKAVAEDVYKCGITYDEYYACFVE
ncbi:MAG: D-alanyl-D-alanine carboxypeptidase family protein [Erysipelotrichaceae bacterium]|nr:D-alanyl-D-alanine carboxypeptidase family protein [Erysipelotrichaceae bacterium]